MASTDSLTEYPFSREHLEDLIDQMLTRPQMFAQNLESLEDRHALLLTLLTGAGGYASFQLWVTDHVRKKSPSRTLASFSEGDWDKLVAMLGEYTKHRRSLKK